METSSCVGLRGAMKTDESVVIEQVAGPIGLGEGPHWDPVGQKLYFVDIINQKLYRLDPVTGSVTHTCVDGGPVGVAVPVDGMPDKFIVGVGTNVALVTWNGEQNVTKCSTQQLVNIDVDRTGTRVNDGKVDSAGRFWIGTMGLELDNGYIPPNQGTLYTIDGNLSPKIQASPVSISNGLAWGLKDDTFYYIDSPTYQIWAFNYDSKTGAISNKRVVFDLKKNNITGLPDGMTIDTDGNLWVALYYGESVIQINPETGKLLRSIKLPTKNVTSVAFGGPELDVLYVTTSRKNLSESELKDQPQAGCVFAIKNLGVRGLPPNSFKLKL